MSTDSTVPTTRQSNSLVEATAQHVRALFANEGSGHDWWHIERVWRMANRLCAMEGADPSVVQLAALLHDIADWKFHGGDQTAGPRAARQWLESLSADPALVDHVCDIIAKLSYKGAGVSTDMPTLEGRVTQDADRLDAIGAIGIARAFAYGGHANRLLYDPDRPPVAHATAEAYRGDNGSTINHFHEKLLLLKDRMQTASGRLLAERRHEVMRGFLDEFHAEWDGKR